MKYKKIIIASFIIIAISIYFFSSKKKIDIKVSVAKSGNVIDFIEEIGSIKNINQEYVYSKVNGRINNIYVEEGDIIKNNQILATIDTRDNTLSIKAITEKINSIKATYMAGKSQASLQVERDKAYLNESIRKLNSTKELYKEKVVSLETYKDTLNRHEMAKNSLEKSKEEYKKYISSEITNAFESQIRELEYEREKLQNIEKASKIYVEKNGQVLDVLVKNQEYITKGMPLFEVGEYNNYYMEVDVLAEDSSKLYIDGDVFIEDSDLDMNLKGKIIKIYPKAFSKESDLGISQKRVRIEIKLIGDYNKLLSGYECNVKLIKANKKGVLVIPKNSIFKYNNKDFVFVIKNQLTKLQEVKIGLKGNENVEIKEGLKKGDIVVVSPSNELEENTLVNPIKIN